MANVARHLLEHQKEFYRMISGISERRAMWQVWSDFVECSALSLSNRFDREGEIHDKREKRYLEIIHGYTEKEIDSLAGLLGCTVSALIRNPAQDFFGGMYEALDLSGHWQGQFFTPYHISHMMARMAISKGDETLRERGWIGVSDPACGAGSLLIAARNVCAEKEIGVHEVLFTAQDIDRVVALMCYIQLSVLGCAGYVIVGDSLKYPIAALDFPPPPPLQSECEVWFTPAFYDEVWLNRIRWEHFSLLLREAISEDNVACIGDNAQTPAPPKQESARPDPSPSLAEEQSGQLRLF